MRYVSHVQSVIVKYVKVKVNVINVKTISSWLIVNVRHVVYSNVQFVSL